jgi:hypothetical protein
VLQSQAALNYAKDFSIQVQDDVSICLGESGQLSASGVPAGGSYRWYNENGEIITGETSSSLTTAPIQGEAAYQVAGVLSNGCESDKQTIHVYADTLKTPVITIYRDTLFAQADATFQWYRNSNILPGATQSYYVPESSGAYTVIASSSGCSKESLPYNHIIDPGCTLNTASPEVKLESDVCGPETYAISVTNTHADVTYSIVNSNDEVLSELIPGNGQTLLLQVASASLDSGVNRIRIRADKEGCVNRTLDDELDLNNLEPLTISLEDTIRACVGSNVAVKVSTTAAVAGFEWFDSNGSQIPNQADSVLLSQSVSDPIKYSVRAEHVSGCFSETKVIQIIPIVLETPVITADNGELVVNATQNIQWYLEGEEVEGATSNVYRPTTSGNYSVKVFEGDCEKTSASILFVVTALEAGSVEFELLAYPNPSPSRNFGIRVQSPDLEPVLIQVVDMTGRLLFKKWFDPRLLTTKLPLPELKNGIYTVIASQGKNEMIRRVVIQN